MQAVEERARAFVEKAVEAAEAASRDASLWKEKHQQQTNKMSQLEQKVTTARDGKGKIECKIPGTTWEIDHVIICLI
jgi:hypothetical protein